MATSYSNILKPQPLSASALANAKSKGIGSGISLSPLYAASGGGATGGNIAPKVASPASAPVQQTQTTMPTSTPNYSPSGGNSGVTGLLSSLQSQLKQKESELAKTLAKEKKEKDALKEAEKGDPTPTYSGLVGDLAKLSKEGSSGVQSANQALVDFRKNAANYKAGIYSAPTSARVMQGRDQAVQLANAQTDAALATGVQNALTGQGQQITGLGTAAGYAQPAPAAYGQTVFNPLTGQYEGGSMGGGSMDPVAAIPNYAQQVAGGAMSYDQAMAALGGNPAFAAELNNQIRAINPNFSPVQSNANAAVQGSTLAQTAQQSNALQLASSNAYKALNLLSESYNDLGALQRTPIPGINQAATFGSKISGIGAGGTASYNTAIQEARVAVSQVLAAVGVTPSDSGAVSREIIPDNAGPEQIAAAIRTIEELIRQKVESFSQPGIAPQFGGGGTGTGGLFDW